MPDFDYDSDYYIPTAPELRVRVGEPITKFSRRIGAKPNYVRNLLHRYGGCTVCFGTLWGIESGRVLRLILREMERAE